MKAVNTLVLLVYNGEANRKQAASIKCLQNFITRHVVLNLSRPGLPLIYSAGYHLIPHMVNAFYKSFFSPHRAQPLLPDWLNSNMSLYPEEVIITPESAEQT